LRDAHLRETDCVAGHVGLELRNPSRAAAVSAARFLSRKTSALRGLETGFQSKRLVHQRDERRARSERAALGQHPERKPIENNRTLLIVEARFG
jgi:hypothetical protein